LSPLLLLIEHRQLFTQPRVCTLREVKAVEETAMARAYEAEHWDQYVMSWYHPHRELESPDHEREVVGQALNSLVEAGVLPHDRYDADKLLAHRRAVRERFDIPWTAISPRMQRLLYAINAIAQPQVMVAIGIFCGNTFISNAGAAIGPGACYKARRLVGLEIRPNEAERARRNVAAVDPEQTAEIIAVDGVPWLRNLDDTIDLLYLDADGPRGQGKSIYLDLLQAALPTLRPGSLVLAHNSVNDARSLEDYLAFVRHPVHFAESVNLIVDDQGLEVSMC
jgi:predicted O-methyltransferase YrrM